MTKPRNECIASRAFASLILDYEWPADNVLPALVTGRVLVEDLWRADITATSREELINKFYRHEY